MWPRNGRPEHLKEACEGSLRRLRIDRIDLYQLHAVDPEVPYEDSVGAIKELQDEGKIRLAGVSNVSLEQLEQARGIIDVVSVQNRFNLADRDSEDVLDRCQELDIGFIPWRPIDGGGGLAKPGGPASEIAERHGASTGQVALAWLLRRSPVMLPIPGTSSIEHLEENVAAIEVDLSDRRGRAARRDVGFRAVAPRARDGRGRRGPRRGGAASHRDSRHPGLGRGARALDGGEGRGRSDTADAPAGRGRGARP